MFFFVFIFHTQTKTLIMAHPHVAHPHASVAWLTTTRPVPIRHPFLTAHHSSHMELVFLCSQSLTCEVASCICVCFPSVTLRPFSFTLALLRRTLRFTSLCTSGRASCSSNSMGVAPTIWLFTHVYFLFFVQRFDYLVCGSNDLIHLKVVLISDFCFVICCYFAFVTLLCWLLDWLLISDYFDYNHFFLNGPG